MASIQREGRDRGDADGTYPPQLDQYSIWKICNYLSFHHMKKLRTVSRTWKAAVEATSRFRNCVGLFDQNWKGDVAGMVFQECTRFRGLHFRYFHFKRNTLWEPYLATTGLFSNLTYLQLEFVTVPCQDVVKLLSRCPYLVKVSFKRCKFQLVKYRSTQITRHDRRNGIRRVEASSKSCCLHINGLADLRMDSPAIPPRIHTILLEHSDVFPLCLLDYIFTRAEGVVEKFTFDYSAVNHGKRAFFSPSKEDMDLRMVAFLARNRQTLRSLSIFRIRRGHLLVRELNRALNGERLRLTEITLGEAYCWAERTQAIDFFAFLNLCTEDAVLESLKLRLWHEMDGIQLGEILNRKVNLQKLFLDMHLSIAGQQLQINQLLPNLPHLRELELWDRRIRRIPSMTSDFLPQGVPATLTKLHIYNRNMRPEQFANYLATPRAHLLTHFVLEMAPTFTNQMMQTVINNMPLLEVLGIHCSHTLNDSGLTGLSEETCRRIVKSNSSIIYRYGVDPEALVGTPLSDLKRLKRLSFYCCPNVTDISVFLGFRFTQIKEIDLSICLRVTDVGLKYLGSNNPSLEAVMLLKNQRITHFGLNSLVTNHPNIRRIYTSRRCCNRKMDKQLQYVQDPRFTRVVRIHPRIYRRPHNYEMY